MIKKLLIISGIVLAVALAGYAFTTIYTNKAKETNNSPQVFAESRMLLELWSRYKQSTLEPGSLRTLDRSQGDITTSEGQSYTMMRAVWMDDIDTFEKSWQWTKDNLQRDDNLLAWKFGQKADGSYGVLEDVGGQNSASDADVDIAFALFMAAGRWKDEALKADAYTLIDAIWNEEVVTVNGKPVLAANNIEKNNPESIIVNPSYFAPYAYRVFERADPARDWSGMVDSSYELLATAADLPLNAGTSAGLTPDWIRVNRANGEVFADQSLSTNYGFEALRTPWRLALDYKWNKEERAKQVLSKYQTFYDDYTQKDKLFGSYTHSGSPAVEYETPAMYGGAQGYFEVVHPELAKEYYTRKVVTYYNPDTQSWDTELAYYDDNWVWFGIALHTNYLTDLTELIND